MKTFLQYVVCLVLLATVYPSQSVWAEDRVQQLELQLQKEQQELERLRAELQKHLSIGTFLKNDAATLQKMAEPVNQQAELVNQLRQLVVAAKLEKKLAGLSSGAESESSHRPSTPVAPSRDDRPPVETLPGERFPETRSQVLTTNDVKSWSPVTLRYAINEMYARHGLVFGSETINRSFKHLSWYHPDSTATIESIEAQFSDIEAENVHLLGYIRDSKRR